MGHSTLCYERTRPAFLLNAARRMPREEGALPKVLAGGAGAHETDGRTRNVQYYVTDNVEKLGASIQAASPEHAARAAVSELSLRTGDAVLVRWDVRPDPKVRGGWLSARGREVTIEADWGGGAPASKPKVGKAPAAKEEKPAAKAEKPAAKEEKPAAKAEKPAAKEEKPAAKAEKPPPKEEKPAAKAEKPPPKEEKPAAKAEKPPPKEDKPA